MLPVFTVLSRLILAVILTLTLLNLTVASATSTWDVMLHSAPAAGDRSLGRKGAPVVVLEYASATCPHCAMFHVHSWSQIRRSYIDTGKVRWILRELPLDSLAMAAFMLARCGPAGQYFDTIEHLFSSQKVWMSEEPRKGLWEVMQNRMSREEFDACLVREDLSESIYRTAKQAIEEFGIKSTPTFFINGQKISGAQDFDYFKDVFDRELGKVQQ
jgi:protein-disulfide isomerase